VGGVVRTSVVAQQDPGSLSGGRERASGRGAPDGGAVGATGGGLRHGGPCHEDFARFDVDVAPGGYAWWYLDALSDDGTQGLTIIAFLGSVFSPYYAHARHRGTRSGGRVVADPIDHCAINVALYDPRASRWSMTERDRRRVVRDATRLAIGPSALEWRDGHLRVELDEVAAPLPRRIRGTIDVATDARASHGVDLDPHGRHRWGVIAPRARVNVALDTPNVAWSGEAYADSNRGSAPLEDDFVRWDWSRTHLADGRTAVVYEVERRGAGPLSIAQAFDRDGGVEVCEVPPVAPLARSRWGLDGSVRSDAGTRPMITRSLEDGPFYSRSVVSSTWQSAPVTSVHEHLSLARFERRWVRALLPFRMPRRFL
jgi:carotenoid 1,2-hydratase